MAERTAAQAEMLRHRLTKNVRRLRKWAAREGVGCYRVYDRDIPEVPLAIDWYEGRLHVSEFARRGVDEADDAWIEAMVSASAAQLGVSPDDAFVKTRQRQKGLSQYERVGDEGERFVVSEGGHRFLVNLTDYLDTGLFLDHRVTRGLVEREAAGKRMLNLFAYTGAFSVYAAAGGARSTTTVDMSNTYLAWARDNLALNGFQGRDHRLERADVLAWLDDPARRREQYDLVVVDPPTFSNSKKMADVFDIQRDHRPMLERILRLVAPGGVVWFSTNFRRFVPDLDGLGANATEMTHKTVPPDFRGPIHRSWRLVARGA